MTSPATTYDALPGMPAPCPDGMRHLLTACADAKLLLGYHYGEWTFGTPELEAAVASCSLGQGEMGHVRLLHSVLKKHWGEDPDQLIEQRDAGEFANPSYLDTALTNWAEFVAMNAIVDLAVTQLLHSMRGCAFLPVRVTTDKLLDEERYHAHHGRGWFRTLAAGGQRDALGAATERALASVRYWFGPAADPEDVALVEGGFKDAANTQLFDSLQDELRALAATTDLRLPDVPVPAFTQWDPARRRPADTAPDEEILYHLRGTRNAIFKLN